ncbi:Acyl-carrier protein (citrate lyase gamma subunit) (CitD) [Fructobacillus cardui]|uniref:citrate lyase acyl carrier protein n=1 Tax=Fructobacillus TaxID=559173 RepID=UPI00064DB544|nr:citrate lyase acyl carrier protein [Fructobacillus sp. EFB-N1]KMK53444.1 Citrate lyase acyl carrier protein [Fructobacillus sp. EFB-N1]CAK1222726.1 Acyl-carrier protein (citrate lyase gamma subunit) (CitD) [Fructobacillus cardui]CAK1237218.1 Acyl-carrier protein (citrate lyase gamma subunit) (CitD) [Fructobacillus cardui]
MEIKKTALAGTLESSDVQIMVSQGTNGLEFDLVSDVAKQFGEQIQATIEDVFAAYDIHNAVIKVVDQGALDPVIKSRAITVCQRALDQVDQPRWEVL